MRLPIDAYLYQLCRVSRQMSVILGDIRFANRHLNHFLARKGVDVPTLWVTMLHRKTFTLPALPFSYKALFFSLGMQVRKRDKLRLRFNRFAFSFSPETARNLLDSIQNNPDIHSLKLGDPTLLIWTCEAGQEQAFSRLMLLDNDKNLSRKPKYTQGTMDECLSGAAEFGHLRMVSMLLDAGADPSWEENSALRNAALNGHEDIVRLLLTDARTDASDKESAAFIAAMDAGHFGIARLLLGEETDESASVPASDLESLAQTQARTRFAHPSAQLNQAMLNAVRTSVPERKRESLKLLLADPRLDLDGCVQGLAICIRYEDPEGVRMIAADARLVEFPRKVYEVVCRNRDAAVLMELLEVQGADGKRKFSLDELMRVAESMGRQKIVQDTLASLTV
ncbi:hypothetical protein BJ741DRAFT_572806 [Chytriomyces cf. hyalinus JEL632]|nr:hypothetical protein BJ741DRAFT_572806 [Chytriomyces cf. hyalinus JEL632]